MSERDTPTILADMAATLPVPGRLDRPKAEPVSQTARKFNLSHDDINQVVADMPDAARQAVKWAANYCRVRNLSYDAFGQILRQPGSDRPYSGDSVYQTFTGRREDGSMDRFVEAVAVLRRRIEETAPISKLKTWKVIERVQAGKTAAVEADV